MPLAVDLIDGPAGQPMVRLHGPCGSHVDIYQHGGHITSWVTDGGREMLYLSPSAALDGTKAIRGGIPVCFPQFAMHGPLKQHGLARNSLWALVDPDDDDDELAEEDGMSARVQLVLTDTQETRQSAWPHKFKLVMTVEMLEDGSLFQQLDVHNNDQVPFEFTTALHAYFRVSDIHATSIPGVKGLTYVDNTNGGMEIVETDDAVRFGKEVDRLYYSASDDLCISTAGIAIAKRNFPDVVVWNPCAAKAAALPDMPDDDWMQFVCVEPARVKDKAIVQPAQCWSASILLKAIPRS